MTKIRLNSLVLQVKLNTLISCMSKRITLPVLDYILCEVHGNKMSLTSSNLETTTITEIDVLSDKDIRFLLDINAIAIIKKLKDEDFTIEVSENNKVVTIKCDIGEYVTASCDVNTYPKIPDISSNTLLFELPFEKFQQCLKKSLPFTSNDDLRPILEGIFIHNENKELKFISTDCFYMSLLKTPLDISNDIPFIFPKSAIKIILSYYSKDNIKILLDNIVSKDDGKITHKNIIVKNDDITFIIRSIEGNYPNYKSIIPTIVSKIELSKKMLQEIVENLSIVGNNSSNALTISIDIDNVMHLSTEDKNYQKSGKSNITILHTPIKNNKIEYVTFNISAEKLLTILKQYISNNLTIYLTDRQNIVLKTDNEMDPTVLLMKIVI